MRFTYIYIERERDGYMDTKIDITIYIYIYVCTLSPWGGRFWEDHRWDVWAQGSAGRDPSWRHPLPSQSHNSFVSYRFTLQSTL